MKNRLAEVPKSGIFLYHLCRMPKDFDSWNEKKKYIHDKESIKPYQERDIWWCSLGVNVGFEEDGTGHNAERPVLVMKGFSDQVCLTVPLSTALKKNPYYIGIGSVQGREASAIISQLRLIDTKRLVNKVGYLNRKKFNIIRQAIKEYL